MANTKQQTFSEQEIATRRDDAIRRALNTPPRPYKDAKVGAKKTKPVRASEKT